MMPSSKTLQELIIAVHFEAPIAFSVVDLADWTKLFAPDFPIVQEIPQLAPLVLAAGAQSPFQLQMLSSEDVLLPRMLLRRDGGSLQLQNDRFAFGWNRTEPVGEPTNYPGFEDVQAEWKGLLARFEAWMKARFHQAPRPGIMELTYTNAALMNENGRKKRLSEMFRFVNLGGPVHGFQTTWTENVGGRSVLDARLTAQVGLGSAPPDKPVLAFTFTGVCRVAPDEISEHILSELHDKIRESYTKAIVTDAD